MDYWIRDKKGFKTQITGVKSITYVDVTMYDLSNFRDDPVGLITPGLTGVAASQTTPLTLQQTYIGGVGANTLGVADPVAHVPPRNEAKKWTQIRFWTAKTQTAICATATSTTLTVPSSYYMAAGQGVSGTGIVAGTIITATPTANTVTLSQAATTTATPSLSFDDGELIHFIWASEFRQASNNTFIRI